MSLVNNSNFALVLYYKAIDMYNVIESAERYFEQLFRGQEGKIGDLLHFFPLVGIPSVLHVYSGFKINYTYIHFPMLHASCIALHAFAFSFVL